MIYAETQVNLIIYGLIDAIWESESEVIQSGPILCDPMDCSLPGSPIHWIFQARVLEWVAISFSRGSSWPRDWTPVSCIVGRCFTIWATSIVMIFTGASSLNRMVGTSLVIQSLRNCFSMQGTWVQSLGQLLISYMLRATKPVHCGAWVPQGRSGCCNWDLTQPINN